MPDRIDPPCRPASRGPWPQAEDLDRVYDHGRDWCVHRDAHPDENGGYPGDTHLPATECHTREYTVDLTAKAVAGLDGERAAVGNAAVGLSVYCASPFRFGQPRGTSRQSAPRLVLETWNEPDGLADGEDRAGETWRRVELTLGEALKLARLIEHVVDIVMLQH